MIPGNTDTEYAKSLALVGAKEGDIRLRVGAKEDDIRLRRMYCIDPSGYLDQS